jgi:hypothetical protein
MEGSTEFKKKWRELRDSIQVPAKDAANAHFRNKYRSWDACSKALNEAGIVSHFKTVNDVEQAGVEWWVEIGDEEILVNTCMAIKLWVLSQLHRRLQLLICLQLRKPRPKPSGQKLLLLTSQQKS